MSPDDTEVLLGDSTYLNCSISDRSHVAWQHYAIGGKNNPVYSNGELHPPYDRLRVEHTTNVSVNLIFPSVTYNDAGKYACLDGGWDKYTSAQLIVLGMTLPIIHFGNHTN